MIRQTIFLTAALFVLSCAPGMKKSAGKTAASVPPPLTESTTSSDVTEFAEQFYRGDISPVAAQKTVTKLLEKHPRNATVHEIAGFIAKLHGDPAAMFDHFLAAAADRSSPQTEFYLRLLDAETVETVGARRKKMHLLEQIVDEYPGQHIRKRAAQHLIPELLLFGRTAEASETAHLIGYIRKLSVLGVFDNSDGKGFYRQYPPETETEPAETYTGKVTNITWHQITHFTRAGTVPLHDILSPVSHSTAYIKTGIRVPKKTEAVLRLSTDGPVRIWLNGGEVSRQNHLSYFAPDNVTTAVTLRAGWNRVLIKTTHDSGRWIFGLRVTTPEDTPISGLTASATPPVITDRAEERDFEKTDSTDSLSARALFRHHLELLFTGSPHRARQPILDYLHRTENMLALLYATDAYQTAGETGSYIDSINRALKKSSPPRSPFLVKKGNFQKRKELLDEAEETFRKALDTSPRDITAYLRLAALFKKRDWAVDQYRILQTMRAHWPDHIRMLRLFAYNLASRGYRERSIKLFQQLAEQLPGDTAVLSHLYRYHFQRQEYSEALGCLDRILDVSPDDPDYRLKKGTVHRLLGNRGRAAAFFKKAAAVDTQWALPHIRLATLYYENGDTDRALKEWQTALKLDPENTHVAQRIHYLTKDTDSDPAKEFIPDDEEIRKIITAPNSVTPDDNASVLLLLDHAVTVLNPDGSSRWYVTMVQKALNDDGRDSLIRTGLPYTGKVKVLGAYAISSDGKRREANSIRSKQVRFRKLETGDTTVIQYIHYRPAMNFLRNSFTARWYVQGPYYHTVQSTWKLLHHSGDLNIANLSDSISISDSTSAGYRVKTFSATDVPPLPREPHSPSLDDYLDKVVVSTISSWNDFISWERALLREAFVSNRRIRKLSKKLTADAPSRREALDTIFDFVARDIRYQQDYENYIAGVRPHSAAQVLERGYGDCKDKAVLFIQLATEAGIDVDYVLLRTTDAGDILRTIPNQQFNHAIVYIPEQRGISSGFFMDPTVDLLETGNLRRDDQGAVSLIMNWRTGDFRFEKIPMQSPAMDFQQFDVRYNLDGQTALTVTGTFTVRGTVSSSIRQLLRTRGRGRKFIAAFVSRLFNGAPMKTFSTSDIEDLSGPLTVTFSADASHLASRYDDTVHYRIPGELISKRTIKLRQRNLPLRLGIHRRFTITTTFDIPDSAAVTHTPREYKTEHSCMDFFRTVSQTDDTVVVREGYEQRCDEIPADEYSEFRQAVVDVLSRSADNIILKYDNSN